MSLNVLSLVAALLATAGVDDVAYSPPAIEVKERVEYYRIQGRTVNELAAQMKLLGPVGSVTGKRASGYTDSEVVWEHARETHEGKCRLSELNVSVTIVTTLPEWVRTRPGRSALAAQWSRFMAKLREHEAVHRQHGLQAAEAVRTAVGAIPTQPDCRSLERAVDRVARREVRRYAAESRKYDALTDFGAKQGVRLTR